MGSGRKLNIAGDMPDGFKDGIDDMDNVGITVETDPQVGANTLNYVPRWDGSALVSGNIYNDPAGNIGIGTATPQKLLAVQSASYPGIVDAVVNYNGSPSNHPGKMF